MIPDVVAYAFCTGKVPTFDAVPLDVDLGVPQGQVQAHLPLVVMVGGGNNHKTEWESATVRNSSRHAADGYNNVAFAQLGYAVLTYSSRRCVRVV